MMKRVRIAWPGGEVTATLRPTATAATLLAALPLEITANTWGDEVYFSVPFSADAEHDATEVVDRGAVCFWLDGDAIALLFGPTPVSTGDECRLVSAANIVGHIDGDPEILRKVRSGDHVRVESA
ncbi:MAG: hypothetical protein KDI88_09220 [Gammaproteobacteria bacterium]|nr:hypothetical protein [Gammaproteobacteria bacterium]